MSNASSNDRFPAFNFPFQDHFSLQVKCFDRTFFHFGDNRKRILGFFCFCRFYFFSWRTDKMFKIDVQKPKNLWTYLFFYQFNDTCVIPSEQAEIKTSVFAYFSECHRNNKKI